MLRLLMIADDFTGALDTGVQLAAHGIPTQVVVGQADLSACSSTVLVVDTETRHLSAAKAAEAVARLTRSAVENGVGCIYKKTDSALRGNIGAELAALLKASGARNLPFLPAFPQIGRTTKKGVHYIDGVPVNESPFGIDPFEPVRCAEVTKLIHLQTDMPAQNLRLRKKTQRCALTTLPWLCRSALLHWICRFCANVWAASVPWLISAATTCCCATPPAQSIPSCSVSWRAIRWTVLF